MASKNIITSENWHFKKRKLIHASGVFITNASVLNYMQRSPFLKGFLLLDSHLNSGNLHDSFVDFSVLQKALK